jgi:formiminotetrahydrofolate cyclodeaminase
MFGGLMQQEKKVIKPMDFNLFGPGGDDASAVSTALGVSLSEIREETARAHAEILADIQSMSSLKGNS